MSRSLLTVLVSSTFLMAPGLALAAPAVDDAGATALKTLLQQRYTEKLAEAQKKGDVKIEQKGEITVVPNSTYYAVTYPSLSFPTKEGRFDFGVVKANMMPTDKDGVWKITAALPTPMYLYGQNDKPLAQVDLGAQKIGVVADLNLNLAPIASVNLQNIKISSLEAGKTGSATIGALNVEQKLTEDTPDLWSGYSNVGFKDFAFDGKSPAQKTSNIIKVAEFSVKSTVDKLNAKTAKTYGDKLKELEAAGLDAEKIESPASMHALWEIITGMLTESLNGFDATLAAKGVSFSEQKEGEATPTTMSWDELSYGIGMSGLNADKASGHLTATQNGMNFGAILSQAGQQNAIPAELARYLPGITNFKFTFKDLPHKELLKQFGALAGVGAQMGQEEKACDTPDEQGKCPTAQHTQMMGMQAMMTVPAILGQAGTVFGIENMQVKAADYDIAANGTFKADAKALYGGTSDVKIVFSGMDQVITDLQALAQKPETKPNVAAQIAQALQGLSMVQMFGQQGTGTDGKPARIYDITVDAAGGTKLNGTDMGALMGGAMAPAGHTDTAAPAEAEPTPEELQNGVDQFNAIKPEDLPKQ